MINTRNIQIRLSKRENILNIGFQIILFLPILSRRFAFNGVTTNPFQKTTTSRVSLHLKKIVLLLICENVVPNGSLVVTSNGV